MNSINNKNRFADVAARLQHQIKREKEQASNDYLSFEKIRWPHYKEVIYRRKNQTYLPSNPGQIKRMMGLTRAGPGAKKQYRFWSYCVDENHNSDLSDIREYTNCF